MKYKLSIPSITLSELAKLNFIATYFGYNFKYEYKSDDIRKAFFENEDKNIGYIQKDSHKKLFVIWKYDENIQFIEPLLNIAGNLNKFNIIPESLNGYKMAIGINKLTNSIISPQNLEYICLKKD